jgi:hypothetical protein
MLAMLIRLDAVHISLKSVNVGAHVVLTNLNTIVGSGPMNRGSNFTIPESIAEAFTPSANYILTGAVAFFLGAGFGGAVNFAVYSNAGAVPGSPLATLGTASVPANAFALFSESSPSNTVELLANVSYWFVLSPATSGTNVIWANSGTSAPPFAFTPDVTGASGWSAQGLNNAQFQIDGTPALSPVPEPASALLCLAALAVAAAWLKVFRRHKRNTAA